MSDIDVILTLDIGTSSTRASLYNAIDGMPSGDAVHSIPHEPVATPDGGSTLDADTLVEEAIKCMEAVLARSTGKKIIGVAVCTFWHSTVGVDVEGYAITPILLWSDTRSASEVAQLRETKDTAAFTERTGCPLHTSYLPGRLLYLRKNTPDLFAHCHRFLSPGEYLFSRLFGLEKVTCSYSMASASGLFNQHKGLWDEETLSWIPGLSSAQFSVVDDTLVSGFLPEWQERLSALNEVPFLPALGDGACSNVGCGAITPDRLALMIGTSGAMRVMVRGDAPPVVPPGLWRYQLEKGVFLLGGALTNGGAVWSWLKETVQMPIESVDSVDAYQQQIAALPPDGHGLTVLPFLAGERAPLWRDDLRAVIHGLSAATIPIEIVRAHLEAVAIRFAILRDALKPVAPSVEIIGTGAGLLASPVWAQIITDTLGETIGLSSERQASSRGAALMLRQRLGYGQISDAHSTPLTMTMTPDMAKTPLYAKARVRHERLLTLLLNFN